MLLSRRHLWGKGLEEASVEAEEASEEASEGAAEEAEDEAAKEASEQAAEDAEDEATKDASEQVSEEATEAAEHQRRLLLRRHSAPKASSISQVRIPNAKQHIWGNVVSYAFYKIVS